MVTAFPIAMGRRGMDDTDMAGPGTYTIGTSLGIGMRRMLVVLSIVAGVTPIAEGQYRQNQPPVVKPPNPPPERSYTPLYKQFGQWLEARGGQRFALLWNRRFSASVDTRYREREIRKRKEQSGKSAVGERTESRKGEAYKDEEKSLTHETEESISQVERRDGSGKASGLNETVSEGARNAFVATFKQGGATVIDRATVMRMLAADGVSDRPNLQAIEASALKQKADLLLEIVPREAQNSESGMSWSVKVTDTESGVLLTSFTTAANPPPPPGSGRDIVAGSNGYERPAPPEPTIGDIGRQLAHETMARLVKDGATEASGAMSPSGED